MKKKIILALALLAAIVSTLALPALASFHSHEVVQGNVICNSCRGTGRSYGYPGGPGTGQTKCWMCQGTGWVGSY